MLKLPRVCSTFYDSTALLLKPLWKSLDVLGDLGNSVVACPARHGISLRVLTHFSPSPPHTLLSPSGLHHPGGLQIPKGKMRRVEESAHTFQSAEFQRPPRCDVGVQPCC